MRRAVLLTLLAVGCYRAHERGDAGRELAIDAGRDGGRDSGRDAGRDAGIDAGSDAGIDSGICEGAIEERIDNVCSFDRLGAIPAREASSLYLWYARCSCGRMCNASVRGDRVELDTFTCPVPCDECSNDGACELPALEEGDYRLVLDGEDVGVLPVRVRDLDRGTFCFAVPHRATVSSCDWPPSAVVPTRLCHRSLEDVGTFVRFDLELDCDAGCALPASCTARLEARTIFVTPGTVSCSSECPPCAERNRISCASPPLRTGDYRVIVEGAGLISHFTVRDVFDPGPTICTP
jgi:hypothetical protein